MTQLFLEQVAETLEGIQTDGLYKRERPIVSPQSGRIEVTADGITRPNVVNLCANNYLGLADHPALIDAAKQAMDEAGYGMASVRFICGTSELHLRLESRLAEWLGMDDAILFAACFAWARRCNNFRQFEPCVDH
jgi:glycine C-acetyltransferase